MQLKTGKAKEVVKANIKKEIAAGKSPKQAAAVALSKAGKAKPAVKKAAKKIVKK